MFWLIAALIWIWVLSSPKVAFLLVGIFFQICALGSISSLHSGGELLMWFLWCQGCAAYVWLVLICDGAEMRKHRALMGWTAPKNGPQCFVPMYYQPYSSVQVAPAATPTATVSTPASNGQSSRPANRP